jgi:hypothetical protein
MRIDSSLCPLNCPQGLSHAFHFYTLSSSDIGKYSFAPQIFVEATCSWLSNLADRMPRLSVALCV